MATITATLPLSKNYIGGAWVESKSTQILERRNPANHDDVVARIALSTRQEMKEAIVAAKNAFPAWRERPLRCAARFSLLQRDHAGRKRIPRAHAHSRRRQSLKDALGEVQRAINILEYFAGEARRLTGETLPSDSRRISHTR